MIGRSSVEDGEFAGSEGASGGDGGVKMCRKVCRRSLGDDQSQQKLLDLREEEA